MKNDRHSTVDVSCGICGRSFQARVERVNKGMGRFCSTACYGEYQRGERIRFRGKHLAKAYKSGGRYIARWYDEDGKTCSATYPKWWWEMNVGEVPENHVVSFVDGDSLNIEPKNFELISRSEMLVRGNKTRRKDPQKWGAYLDKQSKKQAKAWDDGVFEKHGKGDGHYRWRGGSSKEEYPSEFYKIKDHIRARDNYICQICGRNIVSSKYGRVHHRDGDKKNSDQNNLLLLCVVCHGKVHGFKMDSPPIMALRSELHWNK